MSMKCGHDRVTFTMVSFRVTTSLGLCWKMELWLPNSLISAHSLDPSNHSLSSYPHKLCNIPSQSQFNPSDSLVQQWHEGYGITIF